ncbi:polysaccharide deacetylase family protein [Antarcticimicrobium luteum]|uniref:Chitooligosaccharide deacetylase n=1 Tax=Antarcticimicrobium luteum TaxID=2547397 RepID=A0A4R5V484_9RHOB|nr:polysaccharide deacetylase family protein [Antarcticimicrobium luteum]TDK46266.1 polysaccharide deacetylase family protein [Antarcticimicrobium luteum]
MERSPDQKRSVLIFHGIGEPQRELEPGEAVFWLSRARFCEILDRITGMGTTAPEITFDDGNASDAEIALPELEKRGLRATFFLLSARIGTPGSLSEADVRRLAQAGHTIGLHGATHRDWRRLDAAGRQAEYRDARQRLAELAGAPVTLAAAPFGAYDRRVTEAVDAEGFEALYTSDRGQCRNTRFLRPRNCIEGEMDNAQLEEALRGLVPYGRRTRRLLGLMRKRLLPARAAT